ncbi:hypothetical protein BASA60_001694 [Batrachochytrium salamandrivorans]|nr:hypothetical protein BASA60_001694 [Batrachochytrium salamandrivorans]
MDGPKLKPGEVNLGTTIMAVQYADGVVVAADSRTTMGSQPRFTDKLTQIHERIFCCRSGSAADTQAVADIVHYHLQLYSVQEGVLPKVETAANMFQRVVYENKDQLMAGIIIGGWDPIHGPSDNMTREEAVQFTKNAVSLAMSRDGSSGGTIRLAIITKDAVERIFVPGNELPTFWEN